MALGEKEYTEPCPVSRRCGGCQLQRMPYAEQLHHKQLREIRLLGRFGHVEEIIGMADPTHYRNKVTAAFALDARKKVISGVYQSSSHRVVLHDRGRNGRRHHRGYPSDAPGLQNPCL